MATIRIGDRVKGELDEGRVIAMTGEWCVYQTSSNQEYAERWADIRAVDCCPTHVYSPLSEKEESKEEVVAFYGMHVPVGGGFPREEKLWSVLIIGYTNKFDAIRAYRNRVPGVDLLRGKKEIESASPVHPLVVYTEKTRAQAEDLARELRNSGCYVMTREET